MLRQLLSATNGVGSGNVSSAEHYHDHCSIYPLNNRNFENASITLPPPPLPSPIQQAHMSQLPPLLQPPPPSSSSSSSASASASASASSSSSLSLPLPLSPASSSSAEAASAVTSQNQFRINDDKHLVTMEYMSLAAGHSMQTPMTSSYLGILDTSNDLNDTKELFSSTYAMLSADSTLSWNIWDEQMQFSNAPNDFTNNQISMSVNNHNFGYPVHTTTPGCSNNIGYQTCNTGQMNNNYTVNCQGLMNDNGLELQQAVQQQQQQQQQQQVVLPNNSNDVAVSSNYGQQPKCTDSSNQISQQARFVDSNQRMTMHTVPSTGRNYLDQMGGFVENMRICDPRNVANSNDIDPVCPYCDRFISHYKGNIRRHVNQCMKSTRIGNKLRRKDATLKGFTGEKFQFGDGCNETMTFSESYQPHVLETTVAEKSPWIMNSSGGHLMENHTTAKMKSYGVKKDRGNDDPFRCPLCDFATIYKGNMKRHLSTCHGLQDDDLKDGCIDKLKCKEANDSRLENASRYNKRSKSSNYVKATPKLTQMDADNNGSCSSSTLICGTLEKVSESVTPPTFPIVSSFNKCEEKELALAVMDSSDDNTIKGGSEESLSEVVEASSNDNTNQLLRFNTIDETIEAVIANGNENPISEMGTNNYYNTSGNNVYDNNNSNNSDNYNNNDNNSNNSSGDSSNSSNIIVTTNITATTISSNNT